MVRLSGGKRDGSLTTSGGYLSSETVFSVNGKTGDVVLTASSVGAVPSTGIITGDTQITTEMTVKATTEGKWIPGESYSSSVGGSGTYVRKDSNRDLVFAPSEGTLIAGYVLTGLSSGATSTLTSVSKGSEAMATTEFVRKAIATFGGSGGGDTTALEARIEALESIIASLVSST